MRPFFIVGVQRSGTTLLRSILNHHPDIFVAYECAMYRVLAPSHSPHIIDKQKFLDDLFNVPRFDYWGVGRGDCEQLVTDSFSETVLNIALFAAEKPSKWFGFKNPNGVFHLEQTIKDFPNAKIIEMKRDPRAILASEKKKSLAKDGQYNKYAMIWQVALRVRKASLVRQKWRHKECFITVEYASVISDFDSTVSRILEFLKVTDLNLANYRGDIPLQEMHYHSKAGERPDSSRIDAFLSELTDFEIAAVEGFCGKELTSEGRTTLFQRFCCSALVLGVKVFDFCSQVIHSKSNTTGA